jgi:hypothetical protein
MIAEEDIDQVEHANDKRKHASFVKTHNRNSFRNYLHDLAHHLDTIQAHMVEENQV